MTTETRPHETRTRTGRTNAEWLAALRDPVEQEPALAELGAYLRGALAKTMRTRGGVNDSDLDDFTQDALVRILASLDKFRGDSRFTTWATAVAVRVALSSLRRRRFASTSLDEPALETVEPAAAKSENDPGLALDRRPLLDALHRAIGDSLTERQRTVILGELSGVPSGLLVERLGTNPNAFHKLHHDARRKLKRALEEAGYTEEDVRQELLPASERA